jgi:fibronectin type 3 domain-containing protein
MPLVPRKTTLLLAFLTLLVALPALAGPGAFGVAAYPVCHAGIHLSWSPSAGASSYRVFRGGQAIGAVLSASTLAFDDSTSGTSYFVVATDSHGFTFTSESVTPPAANSSLCQSGDLQVGEGAYCAATGPAVHLAWTAGSANGYFITDSSDNLVAVLDGSKSSFEVTGLNAATSYRFSVNDTQANHGQFLTTPSCTGVPGSLTLSATTSCTNGSASVALSWTASSGATQYRIGRDGVIISTTTARTFADTTVTAGHAYSYTISALNGSGSTESNTVPITAATCTSPPGAFAASASAFCTSGAAPSPAVHVTWTASSNAATYVVNRNGAAYSATFASTKLAFDDLTVTAGQTYTYTVTATNSAGSTLSSGQSVTISACAPAPPPSAPVLTVSTICNDTNPVNRLSWTASTGATSYQVFRTGTELSLTLPSTTLAYDDSAVVAGQQYAYFVRATNSAGSADSNSINISLLTTICQPPPQPFALSANTFCDISSSPAPGVNLTWAASANATGYAVFRDDTLLGSVTGTTFTDNSALAGQTHAYLIRASGPGGTTDSNIVNVHVESDVCTSPCSLSCAANVATSAQATTAVLFLLQQPSSCDTAGVTWTFGDGTQSKDVAPFHIYATAGTFRWTVTVGQGTSAMCQNNGLIVVTAPPAPARRRPVRP